MSSNSGLLDEILVMVENLIPASSSSNPWSSYISIYDVPDSMQMVNPKAYSPQVVSIGLIHRSPSEKTQNMQESKKIYMYSLFLRSINPFKTTQNDLFVETASRCVDSMELLVDATKRSYPESYQQLDNEDVARTMLLDGCFILELLLRCCSAEVSEVDSITRNRSKLNSIKQDLIMLENQIPFFVLETLYIHTIGRFTHLRIPPLKELIFEFFGNILNSNLKLKIKCNSKGEEVAADHILCLLHSCYMPDILGSYHGNFMIKRYTATEIFTSGINIKPGRKRNAHLDVSCKTPCLFFWFPNIKSIFLFPSWLDTFIYNTIFSKSTTTASTELPLSMLTSKGRTVSASCCWLSFVCQLFCRGVLEIPEVHITDSTESFLRNMIAYEQLRPGTPRYITSYAFLMDTIINTKEHVEMLETSGVLKIHTESSDTAADLFNSLCNNVALGDKFYLSEQWRQLDTYCKLKWPSTLGSLRVTYFSNPWTSISVFAALVLFAFTGLQTIGTVVQTWYR